MKKVFLQLLHAFLLAAGLGLATSCKDDKDVAIESVALNKVSTEIAIGSNETLNMVFTPANASNQNLKWRSDNSAVAKVDNKGVVTGVALGNANIIAMSALDSLKRDTCLVTVTPSSGQVITVSGDITSDTKWYAKARYKLSGFVYVKNATLTIEPGTIIQGISGTKGTLIIERGSKIMAQGTADKPIIFTSDKAPGSRSYGDWGGVVLCGKATTNKHDSGTGVGIAEGGIGSLYGGTDDNDNSGVLQYARIEFAGIALTTVANSEINGLTCYAVGKATTIDHIQVSYSGDDSYEWFGGTVNCKYLVAWRGWDDDFDTDNGFRGNLQFLVGARDPQASDQSGSNGFESDNDADGSLLTPVTKPIFSNVTLLGPLAVTSTLPANHLFKRAMHIRRSSQLSVYNSVFIGYPKGLLIDGALGNSPLMAESNDLQIENCVFAGMQANYEAASGTVANPYTTTQIESYFTNANRHNSILANITDIYTNALNLINPVLLPNSAVLSGASFTNTRLTNSFFTSVTYKGAFGTENWTSGWCNFDPQNTVY